MGPGGRGLSGWGLFGRGLALGPRAGLVGGKAGLGEELILGTWWGGGWQGGVGLGGAWQGLVGGPGAGLAQGPDSAPSLVTAFCFRVE